jgi:hypothetical protein
MHAFAAATWYLAFASKAATRSMHYSQYAYHSEMYL